MEETSRPDADASPGQTSQRRRVGQGRRSRWERRGSASRSALTGVVYGTMVLSMRKLTRILAVAALLAGCTGEIGPVDHSCHVNPYDELGSGCER